jgi:hypothetical protein
MLDQRGRLLHGGARLRRVLDALLRSRALGAADLARLLAWSGIGHVAIGMHRQGFGLQLT